MNSKCSVVPLKKLTFNFAVKKLFSLNWTHLWQGHWFTCIKKCWQPDKSIENFNSINERDVISWNMMTSGYEIDGDEKMCNRNCPTSAIKSSNNLPS